MQAIILCDGEVPPETAFKKALAESSLFIAADGGAHTAIKLNVEPDLIIGDLDSYIPAEEENIPLFHDPDQETNDLEKALLYAKKQGIRRAVVFGATGKRIDHTLKNLSVLKQFFNRFDSLLFKDRYCELFLIASPYTGVFPVGTTLSLFPLSGKVDGIQTKGLKYPLRNEALENGVRDGSSNETVEETVEITFERGDLLLIVNL